MLSKGILQLQILEATLLTIFISRLQPILPKLCKQRSTQPALTIRKELGCEQALPTSERDTRTAQEQQSPLKTGWQPELLPLPTQPDQPPLFPSKPTIFSAKMSIVDQFCCFIRCQEKPTTSKGPISTLPLHRLVSRIQLCSVYYGVSIEVTTFYLQSRSTHGPYREQSAARLWWALMDTHRMLVPRKASKVPEVSGGTDRAESDCNMGKGPEELERID